MATKTVIVHNRKDRDRAVGPKFSPEDKLQQEALLQRLSPDQRNRLESFEYHWGHLIYTLAKPGVDWDAIEADGEDHYWENVESFYADDDSLVSWDDPKAELGLRYQMRECAHCGRDMTPFEPDPCLNWLPGVAYACCGHGRPQATYIAFENGYVVRHFDQIEMPKWEERQGPDPVTHAELGLLGDDDLRKRLMSMTEGELRGIDLPPSKQGETDYVRQMVVIEAIRRSEKKRVR